MAGKSGEIELTEIEEWVISSFVAWSISVGLMVLIHEAVWGE